MRLVWSPYTYSGKLLDSSPRSITNSSASLRHPLQDIDHDLRALVVRMPDLDQARVRIHDPVRGDPLPLV